MVPTSTWDGSCYKRELQFLLISFQSEGVTKKIVQASTLNKEPSLFPLNIEGDCYGIIWNIHFENALDAFYQWSDESLNKYPLIEPLKSDPIAQGCIGYVNDETGSGASAGNEVGMSGNGLGGESEMFGTRPGSKPVPIFDPNAAKTEAKTQAKSAKQKAVAQSKSSKNSGKKASSLKADTKKTTAIKTKLTTTSKKPQSSKTKQTKATATKKAAATANKASAACTPSAIANTNQHTLTHYLQQGDD